MGAYMNYNDIIPILYNGDCVEELKKIDDEVIDLIITSPPYAQQRKKTYGGIDDINYVEWFIQVSNQLHRVLKSDGTFILNIKENVVNGERNTYVIELILALRNNGWLWTEEYIWCKSNSVPGKWPNRFRDSWERLLQFNKHRKFNMYQDSVKVPIGEWAQGRMKKLSDKDLSRQNSSVGSGFGKDLSKWIGKELVYPTNVLHLPTECGNKKHSAVFPESLPAWFIKLFTLEGDLVLDPFMGSGTTIKVANKMNRRSIGIEILEEYFNLVKNDFVLTSNNPGWE